MSIIRTSMRSVSNSMIPLWTAMWIRCSTTMRSEAARAERRWRAEIRWQEAAQEDRAPEDRARQAADHNRADRSRAARDRWQAAPEDRLRAREDRARPAADHSRADHSRVVRDRWGSARWDRIRQLTVCSHLIPAWQRVWAQALAWT